MQISFIIIIDKVCLKRAPTCNELFLFHRFTRKHDPVYDASPDSERPGCDSPFRHRFFQIANGHFFDPLLHLVTIVVSQLKMHEDMLSPWWGECDSDQVCLRGLAV